MHRYDCFKCFGRRISDLVIVEDVLILMMAMSLTPLMVSARSMVKPDLLTGWGPHYAQEDDISVELSGDDPEVLQMNSSFIHAAGPIRQKRSSHLCIHIKDDLQLTDLIT